MGFGYGNGTYHRNNEATEIDTGRRVRAYFDNSMVAHVWAQQTQDFGRSHNGNFYFHGPVLYSYGSHFVVAVKDAKGAFWLNSSSYSPTTGGHQSDARAAVSGTVYNIPDLTAIYETLLYVRNGYQRVVTDHSSPCYSRAVARSRVKEYMRKNWRSFANDSDEAALLWAIVSRGDWANERARLQSKADKAKAKEQAATKKLYRESAARYAAMPMDVVRFRLIELASNESWCKERVVNDLIADMTRSHKAAGGKRIKAAVWERLKMARGLRHRLLSLPGKYARVRKNIAIIRRVIAGDYFVGGKESNALHQQSEVIRDLLDNAPALSADLRAAGMARLVELQTLRADAVRREQAAEYAEQEERRIAWLSGDLSARAYDLKDCEGGALIRARDVEIDGCTVTGGTLETSQGATVPLAHAVRIFAFVRHARESGTGWNMTGQSKRTIRVGHFSLDRVEPNGDFIAGCHRINWLETERLAKELGVWDCDYSALTVADETEAA